MKLKNSYILLIAMAIFLLISIGSVCASDMPSTDDAILADDGSDDILADNNALIDTKVVSENVKVYEKDKTIPVTVNDNESNPIKIGAKNLTVAEGNKTLKFNYNQSKITITDNLTTGKHNLILSYLGSDVYNKSSAKIVLSVFGDFKIEASSTVNVNQTNKAEVPIKITNGIDTETVAADEFNVELSYKDGNNTKSINIPNLTYENGKLIFTPQFVDNIASYNMTITYKGSDNKTLTHKGILNRITNFKIIPLNTETDYHDGNFTFKVVDYYNTTQIISNKTISVSGNYNGTRLLWVAGSNTYKSEQTFTTDSEGIIIIPNYGFYPNFQITTDNDGPVGNYIFTLTGTNGLSGSYEEDVVIKKIKSKITVEKFSDYAGTEKKVKITVVNAETKKALSGISVFFNMTDSNGKEIAFSTKGSNNTTVKINTLTTNEKGEIELPINLVPGTYSIFAKLYESINYNVSEDNNTATIKEIPVKYTISDTGVITVTNKLTNKPVSGVYVVVKFDNNKNKMFISQTNKNGQIEIVTVGKHTIEVSDISSIKLTDVYAGSTVKKTISNKKITATISAPKVTAYYKDEKYFTVKVTNSKKKAIYDAKVNIRVYTTSTKYYEYTGNTGINGEVGLLINLAPKTYKVEVKSGDTKSYTAKKVTSKIVVKKAPAKLTPTKLTAKKGAKKYFKVTVKNTKTKKVIKGVKVKIKVYTGKKYKTYTVKTNNKGIAQLNVKSLKVGTHKVVITSANKYVTAKTAKSTIKITKK